MSRMTRLKSIDGLIEALQSIAMSQRSLSELDVIYINESIEKLNRLRKRKGLTNKHYQDEIADVVELILNFFTKNV